MKYIVCSLFMLSAARVLGMSCLNECETWGISMRGGAFPTWFSSRSDSVLFFNDSEPIFKRTAKFKEQFSVPWYIQAEGLRKFGQGAMNLLLDAAYIRASGRTKKFKEYIKIQNTLKNELFYPIA